MFDRGSRGVQLQRDAGNRWRGHQRLKFAKRSAEVHGNHGIFFDDGRQQGSEQVEQGRQSASSHSRALTRLIEHYARCIGAFGNMVFRQDYLSFRKARANFSAEMNRVEARHGRGGTDVIPFLPQNSQAGGRNRVAFPGFFTDHAIYAENTQQQMRRIDLRAARMDRFFGCQTPRKFYRFGKGRQGLLGHECSGVLFSNQV